MGALTLPTSGLVYVEANVAIYTVENHPLYASRCLSGGANPRRNSCRYTALLQGCVLFVTNDNGFRRIPDLPLVILEDILVAS